jgi:3-dehydroquinate synthase
VADLGAEPAAVIEALSRDKKARDGRVPFVLAPEIGRFQLVFDVPPADILATLNQLAAGT